MVDSYSSVALQCNPLHGIISHGFASNLSSLPILPGFCSRLWVPLWLSDSSLFELGITYPAKLSSKPTTAWASLSHPMDIFRLTSPFTLSWPATSWSPPGSESSEWRHPSKTPGKASEVLGSLKSKLAVATESNSVFKVELCLQANFSDRNGAFQHFQLNLVHTYMPGTYLTSPSMKGFSQPQICSNSSLPPSTAVFFSLHPSLFTNSAYLTLFAIFNHVV